jgi:hypothetical protein
MILATKAAIATTAGTPYLWVAVGGNGKLYTSDVTDATSWTERTSSFSSSNIFAVASDGQGNYVAVGADGKLATSSDAITWTQQTSSFSTSIIYEVAYGNGYWVAMGEDGKSAYSTDGVSWTQTTAGSGSTIGVSISYGDGLWVAGSGVGVLKTATDPTATWTTRTSTFSAGAPYAYYAPDQAIWVAGSDSGTSGALASSTNGTTWTARTSSTTMIASSAFVPANFAATDSIIVLAQTTNFFSNTGDIQTSTNGTSWTDQTPAVNKSMTGIAVDDLGNFIIVGGGTAGAFQTSSNGTSWTSQTGITGVSFLGICHSSGVPAIR